jgi:hypothetical protein
LSIASRHKAKTCYTRKLWRESIPLAFAIQSTRETIRLLLMESENFLLTSSELSFRAFNQIPDFLLIAANNLIVRLNRNKSDSDDDEEKAGKSSQIMLTQG